MGRTNHTPHASVPNKTNLPTGKFEGKWTGYIVILEDGKETEIFTDIGMRGVDIPVTVEITEATIKIFLK